MSAPARTLRDAFNAVDPAQPLQPDDPRYVDCTGVRGDEDVVGQLFNAISRSDRPLHQLCTGHRGSGKSTELLRLKARLEQNGYAVVYFEADDDLDLNDLVYSDLLLAVARQIESVARERNVSLEQELKGIERWFAEVVYSEDEWRNIERELHAEASLGIGLPEKIPLVARLFAKLTGQIKTGHAVKQEIRRKLDQQVSQLITGVNELIQRFEVELRKQRRQGVVIIVDNLDRLVLKDLDGGRTSHEALFVEHGEQLRSPECHTVYTVPISMLYSTKATQLTSLFPRYQVVPMIRVSDRRGTESPTGLACLKDILAQRIDLDTLCAPDAVDALCRASGGHPRQLMALATYAIEYADEGAQPPITIRAAERAVGRLVNEYGRMIPETHFPLLARVHQLKSVQNDADHQTMLYNLSVLEYTNGQPAWHDVHPVVLRLPKFKEAWEGELASAAQRPRKRRQPR
ncbi:MAG TPA: hypothetical protein VJG32_00325 [Anaerolineae bacterium]|nr:hypothetical protein [Anaerolineae bacterium]